MARGGAARSEYGHGVVDPYRAVTDTVVGAPATAGPGGGRPAGRPRGPAGGGGRAPLVRGVPARRRARPRGRRWPCWRWPGSCSGAGGAAGRRSAPRPPTDDDDRDDPAGPDRPAALTGGPTRDRRSAGTRIACRHSAGWRQAFSRDPGRGPRGGQLGGLELVAAPSWSPGRPGPAEVQVGLDPLPLQPGLVERLPGRAVPGLVGGEQRALQRRHLAVHLADRGGDVARRLPHVGPLRSDDHDLPPCWSPDVGG